MEFDASPSTLKALNDIMRHDPRVVRWTNLKVGEKLQDIAERKETTITRA